MIMLRMLCGQHQLNSSCGNVIELKDNTSHYLAVNSETHLNNHIKLERNNCTRRTHKCHANSFLCHSLCYMTSTTPDLRLPFQVKSTQLPLPLSWYSFPIPNGMIGSYVAPVIVTY